MSTLKEICTGENRPRIVQDTTQLVEDEVRSKGGLSGAAIKTAYKAVKKIKPGLIPDVIDGLLDRFVDKLEPFYKEWVDGGKKDSFDRFLSDRKSRVANALLEVTDERARVTSHRTIKKSYGALRPQGEKHVTAAVPGLGRVMSRYV